MERLTKIYPSGAWGITGELDDAILRLAAYEDTGLEPEEIIRNGMMLEDSRRHSAKLELKLKAYEELGPIDRFHELAEADREGAVHIGSCGFCEYYQMDKFCCCPDWVEDSYAIIRKPKDYCTKFKKAGWVDEVWGENGCPSCPGYKPEKAEQEGRT